MTMLYLNSLNLVVLVSALLGTYTQANSPEFSSKAQTQVQVTDKVLGKTPAILGINTGDMPQGSAFPEWVRALGVNGARLRLNVDPKSSQDPKISSATDLARKAKDLRAQTEKTPLLWHYPSRISTESLRSLRESKIELLATITCPYAFKLLKSDGKTNWSNSWSFWEAYYAQAYQLATQHQVRRYQLFNEPNHKDSAKLTQEEYSVRMVIGTDAIQAALSDAAKTTKTDLPPLISAPCTAGISNFKKAESLKIEIPRSDGVNSPCEIAIAVSTEKKTVPTTSSSSTLSNITARTQTPLWKSYANFRAKFAQPIAVRIFL